MGHAVKGKQSTSGWCDAACCYNLPIIPLFYLLKNDKSYLYPFSVTFNIVEQKTLVPVIT